MASLGNEALDRRVGHPQRTCATTMGARRSHQVRTTAFTMSPSTHRRCQRHPELSRSGNTVSFGIASETRTTFGCITPQGSVGDGRSRSGTCRRGGKVGYPITRIPIPRDDAVFFGDRFKRSNDTCSDRWRGRARGTFHTQRTSGGVAHGGTVHRVLTTVVPDNPTPKRAWHGLGNGSWEKPFAASSSVRTSMVAS